MIPPELLPLPKGTECVPIPNSGHNVRQNFTLCDPGWLERLGVAVTTDHANDLDDSICTPEEYGVTPDIGRPNVLA